MVDLNTFEWDENKNKINIKKHKISFETAVQIFDDKRTVVFFDEEHSDYEDRYVAVGVLNNIISVVFTERVNGKIRIISAQKASEKYRRKFYEYSNL